MRLFFLFFFIPISGFAQNTLDNIIEEINFEGDTIESLFKYVSTSVAYDTKFKDAPPQYHSYDEVLKDVLEDQKGVCMHYATLFHALCTRFGYRSYMIAGYTKFMNQETGEVPHAWNAVEIDGKWYLFDPTWAAGYVISNTFFQRYDPDLWYKKDPDTFIYSHIPFDPVFQFLTNPISHHAIADDTYKAGEFVNFNALLKENDASGEAENLVKSLQRISNAGITNKLITNKVNYLEEQINIHRNNEQVYTYSNGAAMLLDAEKEYQLYLSAKEKNFKKWSEDDLYMLLQSSSTKIKSVHYQLTALEVTNRQLDIFIREKISYSRELLNAIEQEEQFFNKYINIWKPLRIFVFP